MKFLRSALILILLAGMQATIVKADPAIPQGSIKLYFPVVFNSNSSGWIGPDGGSVLGLAVDPANSNIVYAGTFGAGLFKSVDGGVRWVPINNGLDNPKIQSFAIDPMHTNVLYAGTYRDETGNHHEGIYKSTDAGQSWVRSSAGIQFSSIIYTIAVDPVDSNNIYIGTRGQSNGGINPWNGKVYRSIDAGSNWIEIPGMSSIGGTDQEDWVYSIVVHPGVHSQVFAATHEHGPYYSTNYGVTWSPAQTGVVDGSGRAIVVDPQSGNSATVYLGVWKYASAYRSLNGGVNWIQINKGLEGVTVYGMTINPQQPSQLFIGSFTNGVHKTTDYGLNWNQIGLSLNKVWIVALTPDNPAVVYSGTFGDGIYKSTNSGASWSQSQTGIHNAWITAVVSRPGSSTERFASLNGGGVVRTTDSGRTWSRFATGLPDLYINSLAINPAGTVLYALTDTHGLYRISLSGGGWSQTAPGLPEAPADGPAFPEDHPFATWESLEGESGVPAEKGAAPLAGIPGTVSLLDMEIAQSNPQINYLATDGSGIYRSNDGGVNWSPTGLASGTIWSLTVDPLSPDTVYAAISTGGAVKYSTNGGSSWGDLPFSGRMIYSLLIPPVGPGILYAGTENGIYAWNGAQWNPKGLTGVKVSALTAHPTIPGKIIAGTVNGIFTSSDSGNTWQPGPSELTGLTIQSINLEPVTGMAYYGTTTRGIYQEPIP